MRGKNSKCSYTNCEIISGTEDYCIKHIKEQSKCTTSLYPNKKEPNSDFYSKHRANSSKVNKNTMQKNVSNIKQQVNRGIMMETDYYYNCLHYAVSKYSGKKAIIPTLLNNNAQEIIEIVNYSLNLNITDTKLNWLNLSLIIVESSNYTLDDNNRLKKITDINNQVPESLVLMRALTNNREMTISKTKPSTSDNVSYIMSGKQGNDPHYQYYDGNNKILLEQNGQGMKPEKAKKALKNPVYYI